MTTENRAGHAGRIAVVAAVTVVFAALVVFPGFLAAGLSRIGPPFYYLVDDMGWVGHITSPATPPVLRTEMIILAPSTWLMKHSEALHRFYMWEYRCAGGPELVFVE